MTLSTEPSTEAVPLMPHIQATIAGLHADSQRMPNGKGMPISNPSGASRNIVRAMRMGNSHFCAAKRMVGAASAWATTKTSSSGKIQRRARPPSFPPKVGGDERGGVGQRLVARLPIPLKSNRENSTTTSE